MEIDLIVFLLNDIQENARMVIQKSDVMVSLWSRLRMNIWR